jgi:putative copper export protein
MLTFLDILTNGTVRLGYLLLYVLVTFMSLLFLGSVRLLWRGEYRATARDLAKSGMVATMWIILTCGPVTLLVIILGLLW